jgi:hypothetical protein
MPNAGFVFVLSIETTQQFLTDWQKQLFQLNPHANNELALKAIRRASTVFLISRQPGW